VGQRGGIDLGAGVGHQGLDLGDQRVGAAEAVAGAAPQDVEGSLLAGLAQLGVGRNLALGVLEKDVLTAVAGNLEGDHHVASDGVGPQPAVTELGGKGILVDGGLLRAGDGGEDGDAEAGFGISARGGCSFTWIVCSNRRGNSNSDDPW